MTARERQEEVERIVLSPRAALSACSKGRDREEEPCAYRPAYQRDRDRIRIRKRSAVSSIKRRFSCRPKGSLPYPPDPYPRGIPDRPYHRAGAAPE